MEMITANDLYYIPRIQNLEEQYQKVAQKYNELNETWNEYLETEKCCVITLNLLSARMQTCKEIMDSLEFHIDRIRFETLN